MIPKLIHYCWFGGNEKPAIVLKCIDSWKKYMPGYQIIEWNESNYDVSKAAYMKEAYEEKKWAFVSDYARFDILNICGGLYFDTDVELLKPIPDDIIKNKAFTGIESGGTVNPGLVFGSIPNHSFLIQILDAYNKSPFHQSNGAYKTVNIFTTEILDQYGFVHKDMYQYVDEIAIYPSSYFCGYDQDVHDYDIKRNTISVHHYSSTWKKRSKKAMIQKKIAKIIGKANYKKLLKIKRKFFGYSK